MHYPPMQSLMRVLLESQNRLYFVGICSDIQMKMAFEKMGVTFVHLDSRLSGGQICRIRKHFNVQKKIRRIVGDYKITDKDLLWIEYSYLVYTNYNDLKGLRYIAHFYEFVNDSLGWKYKLFYSDFNMKSYLQKAVGVIHCEYNRAIITKGLYSLEKLPYILPNKPYFEEKLLDNIPEDISFQIREIENRISGKKVILYQGSFESKERRLEEFCQAVDLLPCDYILVAMGFGGEYFQSLKNKYESERIYFVPYIKPPYHLRITKHASIGVLTYNPLNTSIAGVINPLYCAPNKIFEFSRYGIPMISNDVPGLKYIFKEFQCGMTVSYPVTPEKIAHIILQISKKEHFFHKGSENYYNTVDFKEIVNDILADVGM